jgi:hypothetical protein
MLLRPDLLFVLKKFFVSQCIRTDAEIGSLASGIDGHPEPPVTSPGNGCCLQEFSTRYALFHGLSRFDE